MSVLLFNRDARTTSYSSTSNMSKHECTLTTAPNSMPACRVFPVSPTVRTGFAALRRASPATAAATAGGDHPSFTFFLVFRRPSYTYRRVSSVCTGICEWPAVFITGS